MERKRVLPDACGIVNGVFAENETKLIWISPLVEGYRISDFKRLEEIVSCKAETPELRDQELLDASQPYAPQGTGEVYVEVKEGH